MRDVESLANMLSIFSNTSGQEINFDKSMVFLWMNSWTKRLLSYGGKEVFIKAVLQSIPTYAMSIFLAPKGVIEEIQAKLSRTWWAGKEKGGFWTMVPWKTLLGLGSTKSQWDFAPHSSRAKRLWCALVRCSFRSSTIRLIGWAVGRCAWALLLAPCYSHRTVEPHSSSLTPLVVIELKGCDRDPVLLKKLVVGLRGGSAGPPHGEHRSARPYCRRCAPGLNWPGRSSGAVTLKKLERTTAKAFAKDVFINQERKLGARRRSDTVLVSTINDADQGSADVAFRTPPAPYEKSKSLGSGGSMVARLKLKGIDGRAPPGVEPAA
ncbi:hypothetical protein GOBAR_DD35747 [Gossypium barbadense]|nr:hypothetical protein GOBAR_DD35747 [Gossypium barbadense]